MKIVHVISSASAAGAEILAKNLVIAFQREGHDAGLWILTRVRDLPTCSDAALAYEAKFISELSEVGITVRFMEKRPKQGQFSVWKTLRKAYDADQPEVVHTHLEAVSLHVALGLWGKRVKLVQTLHNVRVLFPLLFRTFFRLRFDAFVAISDKVGVELRRAGIPSRQITRIYNGIAPFSTDSDAPPRQWPPKRCIVVGRLTPQKNHALLLDAFAQLKEQLPAEQLPTVDIYGDGPLRDEVQAKIESLGIAQWISLKGVHTNVPALLAQYDLYLMTSSWEGLSLSLIEALYAGIPVLATRAGSNDEIITDGETGWLVPVGDAGSLSTTWKSFYDNQFTIKAEKQNLDTKISAFNFNTCSKHHINLYNKLIGR